MRVAISSQGDDLDSGVDPRFGRASRFLLVDTKTMSFEVIENTQSLHLPQGAGIQAAGVEVVTGVKGKIMDVIQAYLEGRYQPAKVPNVEAHWV
ncbi:MAG: NifB/NifX family molybdenum-iron cluster-binding protein [Desulfobacteraceae bacterium]|nr:NifB/NifX family molybdenum-iron cluster-binding protein [Desulfobacteraceae bacterium]